VEAQYAGSSDFLGTAAVLSPAQLVNTPPSAGPDTILRTATSGAKAAISALLANDSDADGDTVTLVALSSASAQGGTVSQSDGWVLYTPPDGFASDDSFCYTIGDGRGEPVPVTVSVVVLSDEPPAPNLAIVNLGDGTCLLCFDGVPGITYRIEYSEGLEPPGWQPLGQAAANGSGQFQFVDSPPAGSGLRFYRSVYP